MRLYTGLLGRRAPQRRASRRISQRNPRGWWTQWMVSHLKALSSQCCCSHFPALDSLYLPSGRGACFEQGSCTRVAAEGKSVPATAAPALPCIVYPFHTGHGEFPSQLSSLVQGASPELPGSRLSCTNPASSPPLALLSVCPGLGPGLLAVNFQVLLPCYPCALALAQAFSLKLFEISNTSLV
jgi:hypothetical protein